MEEEERRRAALKARADHAAAGNDADALGWDDDEDEEEDDRQDQGTDVGVVTIKDMGKEAESVGNVGVVMMKCREGWRSRICWDLKP